MSIAVCAFAASMPVRAQEAPAILEQLRAQLEIYETQLSAVVADEVFEQVRLGASREIERRRLTSDFGFVRLPGGEAWLGQRSVRAIDGHPVGTGRRLEDLLASARGRDVATEARAIALGNAVHNLGHPRTINTPTLPLELLSRRNAARYTVVDARPARVRGTATTRIDLRERRPGAIVAHDATSFVAADVQAWVAADGTVLRAVVVMQPPATRAQHRLEVEYALDATLGLVVPVRLTETLPGRTMLQGTATYSHYRRFQTAGRLVPPPQP